MSGWLVILAIVIAVLSLPGTWVQAYRVFQQRTTAGLSVATQVLWVWSSAIWCVHAWAEGNVTLFITCSSSGIGGIVLVGGAVYFSGVKLQRVVAASVVFAVVCFVGYLMGGTAAIGALSLVMSFGSRIPQAYASWKDPVGKGVSAFNFASSALCSALWTVYACFIGDAVLAVSSAYCLLFGLFVVGRHHQGKQIAARQRFDRELEAALLYERHRFETRRMERTLEPVEATTSR